MNYSPDEFEAVSNAVEAQGGALLPDICVQLDIKYEKPSYKRNQTQRRATCGCGNLSRFVSEYPSEDGTKSGFITACAVCDSMGAWPRYKKAFIEAGGEL